LPSTTAIWIHSKCLLLEFKHFKLWKRVSATITAADTTYVVVVVLVVVIVAVVIVVVVVVVVVIVVVVVVAAVAAAAAVVVVLGVTDVGILIRAVQHTYQL
jgi:hypothetical protein